MKVNQIKILVIILLASLLVTFTHCGKPTALTFESGAIAGDSLEAFEKTVYPITRSYCVSCHSSIQPMHAADDVTAAYKAVVDGFKVNFSNIQASRLVAKLRDDQHNCWGDCASNAAEMQAAIEKWNESVKKSDVEPAPSESVVYTEETQPMEMEFSDPTNPLKTNSVKLEIEAAMLQAPMEIVRPIGAEAYLSVTSTGVSLPNNSAAAGRAFFNFRVPANGQYRLWALAHGPSNDDNGFYVNILNANNQSVSGGVRNWDIPVGTRFEWRQVPNIAPNLVANTTYTLDLRQREDGARVAGFIITSDTSFNGQEVDDYFGVTLSFDLSSALNIPDVSFLVDVIDYDMYSYKFSNPRIITSSGSVYVKGVKIYVNNVFSPQHSTYTYIDKVVTPADPVLFGSSMIVLKDRGTSFDRIKFSFDQLSPATGGGDQGGQGGATGGSSPQSSLMAFQATVYPISRSSTYSCVGCHMSVAPRHSSDNTLTAHDSALGVVDFNNPQNSRIVNKMRVERHNCGANCDGLANLYEAAIIEWRNRRQ